MSRLWEDAAGILETANSQQSAGSDFAILLDRQNGIRIVDATGWSLDALRAEYQTGTAFLVTRTATRVRVEAQSGSDHCAMETARKGALPALTGGFAHHLVHQAN